MRTAESSLMSVQIFGYPVYMGVAVVSLIFVMHGRKISQFGFVVFYLDGKYNFDRSREARDIFQGSV